MIKIRPPNHAKKLKNEILIPITKAISEKRKIQNTGVALSKFFLNLKTSNKGPSYALLKNRSLIKIPQDYHL